MKYLFIIKRWLFAMLCASLLSTACSKEPATTSLELSGYNHTKESIGSYAVSIVGGEGSGAGYLDSGSGGGGFTCCVSVPTVWRPDMTVTVKWDGWEKGAEKNLARVVPVPKYDAKTAGLMNVHFLQNGEVKVFVTQYTLGHPDYPLKGMDAKMPPSRSERRAKAANSSE
jgi:hypothetical protein